MPCRDGGPEPEASPAWMLCEAMVILEKNGLFDECSDQLKRWWDSHKAVEEGRVRREAAARLDPRQRLALGIDENGNPIKRGRR